jgi:predicted acetyltransferase
MIELKFAGRVPIRSRGEGRTPVPGWTGDHEWQGSIPLDELPHCYNPPQGYIISANDRVGGEGYPHFLGRKFSTDDRAQRIAELIDACHRVDVDYARKMQFDLVSPSARTIAGYIGGLGGCEPRLKGIVRDSGRWDGELGRDSPIAAVYQVFARCLLRLPLSDRLGEDLLVRYAGLDRTAPLTGNSVLTARTRQWLQWVLSEPDSHWFDLGPRERRDEVLRRALRQAVDQEQGINLPSPDHVPETFLFAFVGKRIVGRTSIRHALNPSLLRVGGHIGYVVVPEFRRRGYGTTILALSVRIARDRLGLERVLVTCDDDNIGSIRVIEKNGGVLENLVAGPDLDKPKRRYWIDTGGQL